MKPVLVYGLAVAGEAVARALVARGIEVVIADDNVMPRRRQVAAELGAELVHAPEGDDLATLISGCDLIVPAPGVPESHRLIGAARAAGRRVVSELELAYEWEQERTGGPRPILAVT